MDDLVPNPLAAQIQERMNASVENAAENEYVDEVLRWRSTILKELQHLLRPNSAAHTEVTTELRSPRGKEMSVFV